MTADLTTETTTTPAAAPPPARQDVGIVSLLTLRWLFLALVTGYAFHGTLLSLIDSTRENSLNGYILLMPIAAAIAAAGVARRERVELPIHDRQTDIIVGILGLLTAVMLQSILLPRYSIYFHLLRIDLAALWLFLTASGVILFGLRPVVRFSWVWLMLLLSFPVGYQLSVIAFGGNRISAGVASLFIAAVATSVAVGRNWNRALVGAIWALMVGLLTLTAMTLLDPNAPLLAFQLVPASTAMLLVGIIMYVYARRGLTKRLLDRKIEPVAARQIWAGIPLVLLAAFVISTVPIPDPAAQVTPVEGMTFGRPLVAPDGWRETQRVNYPWVRRVYGRDADLIRQRFVAEVGNPEWDKFARPRAVIVDSTSTWQPFSLRVYPTQVLYDESSSRISDPRPIDLGSGVTAGLVTVVDDKRLLTYNLLTWTWGDRDSAQRIMVAAVDDHENDVVFPEPGSGFGASLRTMISVFFRGNQAVWDSDPTFKDEDLLTSFGRGLVAAQLREAGAR